MSLLEGLNELQRQAVVTDNSPLIIIAGPGTGKTKTLTTKIAYLISQKNISPENILALTFTQKAAAEMKDRLKQLLPDNSQLPHTTTFHSLGFQILSNENTKLNIISNSKREELLSELKLKHNTNLLSNRDLSTQISLHKSSLGESQAESSRILDLITAYNDYLASNGLVDYEDLLLKSYQLLQTDNQKRNALQNTFQYILIDEFQDTNLLQYELIKQLLTDKSRLLVIGDPLQSIYSFRGADPTVFKNIQKDFPQSVVITLTDNYRSHTHIIEVCSALFPGTAKLQPQSKDTGNVSLIRTMHEYSEADYIVNEISNKVGGTDLLQAAVNKNSHKHLRFSDFAVIYRTHQFSNILEQKFSVSGIPYQIIGSNSPYERSEVAFIISVLKFLHENKDDNLEELIRSPSSQLSPKTLKALSILTKDHKVSLQEALKYILTQPDTYKKQITAVQKFSTDLDSLQKHKDKPISLVISEILEKFTILKSLKDNPHKVRNLQQFQSTMLRFDSQENSLGKCIEYFTYLEEHEFYDPISDKVTLLSMHAAKGLEFKHVYICGFEEGIIPFGRKDTDIEEEKRLLYVAMTRAKEELCLLYTKERNKKASVLSSFKINIASPALIELDDEAILKIEKKRKKLKNKKSQMMFDF